MAGDDADAEAVLDALLDAAVAGTLPGQYPAMPAPDPLVIAWRRRQLHVRHDDPTLGVYTGTGQQLRAAVQLASDVEGLRLVLASTVGERYRVKVSDDGAMVALSRLL